MKVVVIGRQNALASYAAKWEYVPSDIELTIITPPSLKQTLQNQLADRSLRWPHIFVRAWMTDRLSPFGFEPFSLWRHLCRIKPDLIHVDEEPPSFALLELLILKKAINYRRLVFVTWENIRMPYLLPFALIRRLTLKQANAAIAGNSEAATILRADGFRQPIAVIPLTATDTARFVPGRADDLRRSLNLDSFTIGYVGRLVPEKGVVDLLQALSQLSGDWQGLIVGRGPQKPELEQIAQRLGIAPRLRWVDTVAYQDTPRYYAALDALVVPSLTAPRWKEQFGRVLAEAMACEVPVVGSNSGSIPEVIGDAGLVFPEGDSLVLAQHLSRLQNDATLRQTVGQRGRQRVLENYTNERIAERVVAFWREVSKNTTSDRGQ